MSKTTCNYFKQLNVAVQVNLTSSVIYATPNRTSNLLQEESVPGGQHRVSEHIVANVMSFNIS